MRRAGLSMIYLQIDHLIPERALSIDILTVDRTYQSLPNGGFWHLQSCFVTIALCILILALSMAKTYTLKLVSTFVINTICQVEATLWR